MPFFADQGREQLRQMYFEAWRKHRERSPLQPVEAQIVDVLALHPEYHAVVDNSAALDKDWSPEGGSTNPFLHMGLHLAVRDQIVTDRPPGIRAIFHTLAAHSTSPHEAEHKMIECLAAALWNAQRSGLPPDENAYLAELKKLTR